MKRTRDFKLMEARRRQGVALAKRGWRQCEIAEALAVGQPAVSKWVHKEKLGGADALKSKPHPGAKRKLGADESEKLRELLRASPSCFGYEGELWTSPMVTDLIRREFGVKYHPGHVRKLLRELGFSPQRPAKRATQRDEAEIERWRREEWPKIKKAPGGVRRP
jgi:transposase